MSLRRGQADGSGDLPRGGHWWVRGVVYQLILGRGSRLPVGAAGGPGRPSFLVRSFEAGLLMRESTGRLQAAVTAAVVAVCMLLSASAQSPRGTPDGSISAPPEVMRYVVFKGSMAVDGISLTVAGVAKKSFRIWIIPHTYEVTALRERKTGDAVNLEADLIGKYVEKFTTARKRSR